MRPTFCCRTAFHLQQRTSLPWHRSPYRDVHSTTQSGRHETSHAKHERRFHTLCSATCTGSTQLPTTPHCINTLNVSHSQLRCLSAPIQPHAQDTSGTRGRLEKQTNKRSILNAVAMHVNAVVHPSNDRLALLVHTDNADAAVVHVQCAESLGAQAHRLRNHRRVGSALGTQDALVRYHRVPCSPRRGEHVECSCALPPGAECRDAPASLPMPVLLGRRPLGWDTAHRGTALLGDFSRCSIALDTGRRRPRCTCPAQGNSEGAFKTAMQCVCISKHG